MTQAPSEITQILSDVSRGEAAALDRLLRLVYGELRVLAMAHLANEQSNHTLQPTALVHEAFLRLFSGQDINWQNRAHFFGAAAQAMRRILVDHARAKRAAKRGGQARRLNLGDVSGDEETGTDVVIAVDEALDRLGHFDTQKARIVELKFFLGLTTAEAAELLNITPRTVERHWASAKAWLARELGANAGDDV